MKLQPSVRVTSFALSIAVIFCASTVYYSKQLSVYEEYAESIHEQRLSQLLDSVDQLKSSLEKAKYIPSGAFRQTLAADVWKESQVAVEALSALPLHSEPLENIETYIAQVGDYAYYLMRSAAYERAAEDEWQTFCSLYDQAECVLSNIARLKEQSDIHLTTISVQPTSDENILGRQLVQVNDEFPEYASLIYDGPYSDHVSQRTAKALSDLPACSQPEAMQKAAIWMNTSISQVQFEYEAKGQIPYYCFSSGSINCSITKQGGFLLALTDDRTIGLRSLTAEQAVAAAEDFLHKNGLTNMIPSYHTLYEAICTINFISMENDRVAYPDLIKVGVAMDDGSIVRVDSAGYAMNHHQRESIQPAISLDTARSAVPADLDIQSERLAWIPTTGYQEVFCWEFICETVDETNIILYYNCSSGQLENMLILIESDNGTLTR